MAMIPTSFVKKRMITKLFSNVRDLTAHTWWILSIITKNHIIICLITYQHVLQSDTKLWSFNPFFSKNQAVLFRLYENGKSWLIPIWKIKYWNFSVTCDKTILSRNFKSHFDSHTDSNGNETEESICFYLYNLVSTEPELNALKTKVMNFMKTYGLDFSEAKLRHSELFQSIIVELR